MRPRPLSSTAGAFDMRHGTSTAWVSQRLTSASDVSFNCRVRGTETNRRSRGRMCACSFTMRTVGRCARKSGPPTYVPKAIGHASSTHKRHTVPTCTAQAPHIAMHTSTAQLERKIFAIVFVKNVTWVQFARQRWHLASRKTVAARTASDARTQASPRSHAPHSAH